MTVSGLDPDFERRFREAHHHRYGRLLKLVVLRDLVHELHRKKSSFMAKPNSRANTQELEHALRILEHAPLSPLNEDSIEKILEGAPGRIENDAGLARFKKLLSNPRFTRTDRKWERAILQEALRRSWTLGVVQHELGFAEVQPYHENFSRTLWPDGAVLFVESASTPNRDAWRGRWWVTTRKSDPGLEGFVTLFAPSTK